MNTLTEPAPLTTNQRAEVWSNIGTGGVGPVLAPVKRKVAAVDFETFYSKDCSITVQGTRGYIEHPQFEAYLVSIVTSDGKRFVGNPAAFDWHSISGFDWEWVSHNASFDDPVYRSLQRKGITPAAANPERWHCSSDLAAYVGAPRALAGAVEFLYGVKLDKGTRDKMKGKRWVEMSTEFREEVCRYALADSDWCLKLWQDHSEHWPEKERRLSEHTRRIALRGFRVDTPRIERGIEHLKLLCWAAEQKIPWVVEGEKALSYPMLCEQCRKSGIKPPPSLAMDDDDCMDWENRYGEQFPWVAAMRLLRRANAMLKKLETMQRRTGPNGRMDFGLKYFGAHCVTGETEVLTEQGWVEIKNWRGGKIAQYSPDGDQVRFLEATPNEFECSEPVVELAAPYSRGVFTLGHTVPYYTHGSFQLRTLQAGDAARRGSLYLPISGNLVSKGAITADQMRLLVAVQADGHWTPEGGVLQFTFRKHRKIERIQSLLSTLGIEHRVQEFPSTPGQFRVTVSRRHCPEWLTPTRKSFGAWLLDSTKDAREAFMQEIQYWDGHTAEAHVEYYSSDPENIRWVVTLAHLTGRASTFRKGSIVIRERCFAMAQKKHWSAPTEFTGKVYCPTTKTGFWLYRYKDTIGVTGNTGRWSGDGGFNPQNLPRTEMFGAEWWDEEGRTLVGDLITGPDFIEGPKVIGSRCEAKKCTCTEFWSDGVKTWCNNELCDFAGHLEGWGVNLRKCLIPEEGKHFNIADLSQIEPRVLWALCGDKASLALVATGMSPYEAHARATMGWTGGKLKDESPANYSLAKARVLALGYGAGWLKFISMARMYGVDGCFDAPVTPENIKAFEEYLAACKKKEWNTLWALADETIRRIYVNSWLIVTNFRETNKKVTALWKRMHAALEQSIGKDLIVELPNGRKLIYRKIARATDKEGNSDITGIIVKNGRPTRVRLYGGLLVENLVQAVARDCFAEGLLRLDEAGIDITIHIHDEAVAECDISIPAKRVGDLLAQPPVWMNNLPVDSEFGSHSYYTK